MATKPQATTNIRLAYDPTVDVFRLSRPGHAERTYPDDYTLDEIRADAGLTHGYWLRDNPPLASTTWTWVQL